MPIYKVQGPDNHLYSFEGPEDATDDEKIAYATHLYTQRQAEIAPAESMYEALKGGAKRFGSSALTGIAGLGGAQEAGEAGVNRSKGITERPGASLEKVVSTYNEKGLWPAIKEVGSQVPKVIAEQGANLGAMMGSARVGAMAGAPFGPAGAIIGGLGGAAVPSYFAQAGSNIERQIQTGQPVSGPAAYTTALPQAAIDVIANKVAFGRLLGIPTKTLGTEAAEKLAKESLIRAAAMGTAKGTAVEIPGEVTQQMLERLQAGLPLTSDDAIQEYKSTAYQTTLTGPLGAVNRIQERSAAGKIVEQAKQKELADTQAEINRTAQEETQKQGLELDRVEAEGLQQARDEMARQDADIFAPPSAREETPITPEPTTVNPNAPTPLESPPKTEAAAPPTITEKTLDTWGISRGNKEGKQARSAILALGDLNTLENVAAAKDILTTHLDAKHRSTKQIELGTTALNQLDVLESQLQQQEKINEQPTQTIPDNQESGDRGITERLRTEQGIQLPTQRAPTAPEETQGDEVRGMEFPSPTAIEGDVVSGRSEEVGPDTLKTPTLSESPRKEKIDQYLEDGGTWNADNKLESDYSEKPILPSAAERAYIDAKLAERDPQLSKKGKKTKQAAQPVATPVEYSTPEEVQQAVGELLTPNQIARKPPVIVNTLSDLRGQIPDDIIDQVSAAGGKAFTYNDQDYYVASSIPKGAAKGTILHEKGGHLGLPKLLGESRVKALAKRINTWATEARSSLFSKPKVENIIAKEAMERANASGEAPGSDRHNQEVIAYFTEIAVNDPRFNIDPTKNQPKEFDKVVGWLKDLWAGITASLKKLHYAPQKLTAKDVVDLVMGAARVESTLNTPTTTAPQPTPTPQLSKGNPQPTPQDRAIAQQAGIKLRHAPASKGVIGDIKQRIYNATGGSPFAALGNKLVGRDTSFAYKLRSMFGTEQRINPATGKEHGDVAFQRSTQLNQMAEGAGSRGFLELDAEGVTHIRDSNDNLVNLGKVTDKIKAAMKADGMSDVLADTSFAYMMLADRYKSLQAAGIIDPAEFTNAEYLYGKRMQTKYPALNKEWHDMHQAIREKTMKYLVDTGTFTPAKAKEFLDKLEYVPFNREPEPGEGQGVFLRNLLSGKKERHIKGSDRTIKDVLDNVIDNQIWLMKRGITNNAANRVVDSMHYMHSINPLMGGHPIPADDKKGNNIEYLKNGQSQWFKVLDRNDAEIFKAAPALGGSALAMMRIFTGILRKSITLMPSFHYSQIIQDAMRAPLVAGTKQGMFGLLKTSVPELGKNVFGKETPLAKEIRSTGIVGQIDTQDTYDNWKKAIHGDTRSGLTKVLMEAERIAQAQDMATRSAVYQSVIDAGGSQNDASARALMMFNPQNRGQSATINFLIATVPFVNARIQGEYRLLQALQGRIPGVTKADAKKMVLWRVSQMAAFTMFYAMAMSGEDDYERADEHVKNHNFLLGGVKVPVAPELLPLKVGVEKAYRLISDQQFESGEKARGAMREAVAGLLLGPTDMTASLLKPFIESATNHSLYTGKPLVGYIQGQKDVNKQFNEGTSEFSKAISNALQEVGGNTANISPIKLDNFIKGLFGSMGRDALYTVDMIAGDKPERKMNQLPLIGSIFYDMEGGALKSDFFDIKDKVMKAHNTLQDIKKNNPEDAPDYIENNRSLLSVYDKVSKLDKKVNNIRKAKQKVTNQDPSTARPEIDRLDTMTHEMLKQALPTIMERLDQ